MGIGVALLSVECFGKSVEELALTYMYLFWGERR